MSVRKFTEEHKRKIADANTGKVGFWRDKKRSSEDIEKFKKSHLGKKQSEATKVKIGLAVSGSRNGHWKGGKSFEPYTLDWTQTLRTSIRERDKHVCQFCSKKQDDRILTVHHIDYNKENCDPKNLISLCLKCHMKTNSNRDYWKDYFESRS